MNKSEPKISKEAAEEFTQSLGQIMGGGYQQILWAEQQGIPAALGLKLPDWVQRIGGYIKYSIEERRKIVGELSANGLSSEKIAPIIGTHPSTVRSDQIAKGVPRRTHKKRGNTRLSQRSEEKTSPDSEGPSNQILAWAEQEGLESLLWEKIKDRVIPFWDELVESVEEEEAEHLLETICNHLGKYEITKKHDQ